MKDKAPLEKGKLDPERMAILRSLPVEVKEKISGEEAQAFLYNEDLPDSFMDKIRDYLVVDE
jgi:hypothetical protein